jgi:hypothetical protein
MKWHPLQIIPEGWPQGVALIVLGVLALLFARKADGPPAPGRPNIVRFEFAWNQQTAEKILKVWQDDGVRKDFQRSIYWDFGFILFYVPLIGLACIMASKSFPIPILRNEGFVADLVWLLCIAGILDVIEDICMLQTIGGASISYWPLMASLCASIKFFLIIVGLLYVLLGIGGWVFLFFKPKSPSIGTTGMIVL